MFTDTSHFDSLILKGKSMNAQISSFVAEWLDVSGANICCMDAAAKPSGMI
jgi:hypothetical protein